MKFCCTLSIQYISTATLVADATTIPRERSETGIGLYTIYVVQFNIRLADTNRIPVVLV